MWAVVGSAGGGPVADEIALFIELKNGWGHEATLRGRRFRRGVEFHGFESIGAMHDPNVVLRVHRDTHGGTDDPMVGKRLRPEWVDFELGRFNAGGSDRGFLLEDSGNNPKSGKKREKGRDRMKFVFQDFLPFPVSSNT